MKQFSLLLACMLIFASCIAKNSESLSEGKSSASKGESIQFLEDMGVNSSELTRLGKDLKLTFNEIFYSLEDGQRVKLLDDVYHFEGDMEGLQSIIGVKPLDNGYTLVLFHSEYGDSGMQEMAIYDKDGHLCDHLETGTALSDNLQEANEDMSEGQSLFNTVEYKFGSAKDMELYREYYLYDWKTENDRTEPVRTLWKLKKTYKYRITPGGKFEFVGINTTKEGDVDKMELLREEIGDLQMRPASDIKRLDEANAMAARPDVRKDIETDGALEWQMTSFLWGVFNENPQALLTWMAGHRDKDNLLLDLFKSLFLNGTINKSRLVTEIGKMKDDEARKYIDDLTAQWGPIDAVG